MKPGDWVVLYACLAGVLTVVMLLGIYFLAHP